MAPGDWMLCLFEGLAAAYSGHTEHACAVFERVANARAGPWCKIGDAYIAALRSDRAAVSEIATSDAIATYARRDKELSCWLADCLTRVGATDEALGWLANSIERGSIDHRFWSEIDPFLAPLRGDPRFLALMERAREKQREFVV